MPKMLGKELTQHQVSQIESMLRRWRAESRQFLRDIEVALRDRLRRNPRELIRVLERVLEDVNKKLNEMKAYRKKVTTDTAVDKLIKSTTGTTESVKSAISAVKMYADEELSGSDTAEALRDLHTDLTEYTEGAHKFDTIQAVTNMVSDALAESELPGGNKINIVDFSKSLAAAHKAGEYENMVHMLPTKRRVRTYTFLRFPVVPLIGARRKSEEFKGLVDVDPIVFQDRRGKMRARYLVFRQQLIMAVNADWIKAKAKASGWRRNEDIAKYLQEEVDDMAKHAAGLSAATRGMVRREFLIGQRIVTYDSSAHRRAPGLVFFWFVSRRVAPQLISKMRRVRDWSLALP